MGHTYVGLYKGWVRVPCRGNSLTSHSIAANICGSGKIQSPPNIVLICSSSWGYIYCNISQLKANKWTFESISRKRPTHLAEKKTNFFFVRERHLHVAVRGDWLRGRTRHFVDQLPFSEPINVALLKNAFCPRAHMRAPLWTRTRQGAEKRISPPTGGFILKCFPDNCFRLILCIWCRL